MWLISFFSALLLGWSAVLWFVLPIDIFRYSLASIVAMHVAVPAGIVSIWILIRRWYHVVLQAKSSAALASQQDIRNAEKARQKHLFEEALLARRVGIDCRWAAIADVVLHGDGGLLTADTDQTITRFYSPLPNAVSTQVKMQSDTSTQIWPLNSLVHLFDELFTALPAAVTLPIAVCGPVNQANSESETIIRRAHKTSLTRQDINSVSIDSPTIVQISLGDTDTYRALKDIFSLHPDWPGMITIAFDNRLSDKSDELDFNYSLDSETLTDSEKWQGKAGRSLTLLLMTSVELPDVLLKLTELGEMGSLDNLTPHWERQKIPLGMADFLMRWPKEWRERFAAQPVATLHRTEIAELAENDSLTQCAQKLERAIGDAANNASLNTPAFIFEGEVEQRGEPVADLIGQSGWLVHNAGDIGFCGDRMAVLGSAIWQCGIELNPISQATNTVMTVGDCGAATRYVWLALAIQRVAEISKPALCVEFGQREIAINFVVPNVG